MNDMQIFNNPEFGIIRIAVIDGKDYFCGNDVANALCYSSPKNAITRHCKGALYWCPQGEKAEMKYISEGDVYRLIIKASTQSNSKDVKEKAERFETWVFDDVLPTLRKAGNDKIQLPQNPMQLLTLHYEAVKQVDGKVERLEERFDEFEHGLPLFPSEADSISDMVKKKVVNCLGGKNSNAYRDASIRRRTFIDAYQNLKRNFNVRTYKSIKRSQCDRAITIVEQYKPPVFLADEIEQCNLQMTLSDYRR